MKTKTFFRITLSAAFLVFSLGCGMFRWSESATYRWSESSLKNQLPSVESVAVLPFRGEEVIKSARPVSRQMASRLNFLVRDVSILHPSDVLERLSMKGTETLTYPGNVREAQMLARKLDVDAVLLGEVFEYDPYQPPMIGVSLMMVTGDRRHSKFNLDPWTRAAKPPVTTTGRDLDRVAGALSVTYDSNRDDLREQIRAYAIAHVQDDYGFEDENRWLLMDKFLPFVATNLTRRLYSEKGPLAAARKQSRKERKKSRKTGEGMNRSTRTESDSMQFPH